MTLIDKAETLEAVHEADSLELAQHGTSRIADRIAALPARGGKANQSQVTAICEAWVADGRGDECFWEGWPDQPQCEDLTPNMILAALDPALTVRAGEVAAEWQLKYDAQKARTEAAEAKVEKLRGAGLALCNAVEADDGSDHHHFTISGLAASFRAALTTEERK